MILVDLRGLLGLILGAFRNRLKPHEPTRITTVIRLIHNTGILMRLNTIFLSFYFQIKPL